VIGHPASALFEEMAVIALHFHWQHDELLGLTHRERRRWLREIDRALQRAEQTVSEAPQWP
jgi:hypothetical protein